MCLANMIWPLQEDAELGTSRLRKIAKDLCPAEHIFHMFLKLEKVMFMHDRIFLLNMVESDDHSHFKKCHGFGPPHIREYQISFQQSDKFYCTSQMPTSSAGKKTTQETTSFLILDNSTEAVSSYLIKVPSHMYPLPHFNTGVKVVFLSGPSNIS